MLVVGILASKLVVDLTNVDGISTTQSFFVASLSLFVSFRELFSGLVWVAIFTIISRSIERCSSKMDPCVFFRSYECEYLIVFRMLCS